MLMPRLRRLHILSILSFAVCAGGCAGRHSHSTLPGVAPGDIDVRAFGARGDGTTLDTAAFARAIDACARRGGGTVVVPAGAWLSGTIELQSHVHLRLDPGATLLASRRADDYPDTEFPWAPGKFWIAPLIYAHDAQDVGVSGSGTIEGQGASWWAPILAAKAHRRWNGAPQPSRQTQFPDALPGLPRGRPQLIRFLRCTDVVVRDVTLHNSPEWNFHPVFCERVRVDGVTIKADLPAPNTDGINPESCRNVQILNCRIDTGDDCVTLKSGLNEAGRRMGRPDEDITIANCVMYHGHGGVTIGSEMSGGVRNVAVTNCVFHGTDNGIRIKSQRGRGGVVESLSFNNLVMQNVPHPFTITSFYAGKDKPTDRYPVNETTPRIRNILISNIIVDGAKDAGSITGLREMPISDITFSGLHVQAQRGMTITSASDIQFHNCHFRVNKGDTLTTRDSKNIDTDGLHSAGSRAGSPGH